MRHRLQGQPPGLKKLLWEGFPLAQVEIPIDHNNAFFKFMTSSEFRRELEETHQSLVKEFPEETPVLQVAFGGIMGELSIPPFEFYNLTSSLGTNKIFVRDLAQRWYHHELPGIGSGIHDLADAIDAEIRNRPLKKTVFFGNSMGGYAAILVGILLQVDKAIAFSPQTFINFSTRLRYFDNRWRKQITEARKSRHAISDYFNLKGFLNSYRYSRTDIEIHASSSDRLDWIHAQYLSDHPQVSVFDHSEADPEGNHLMVKNLKESGQLKRILFDALKP